jgi:hypothetical protein
MIPCFPDPYPDELLYSICARYYERVQYPSVRSVIQELFGNKNASVNIDLPSYLNHLVANLQPNDYYTVDSIINNHTLLPLYRPFCPEERIKIAQKDMRGNNGSLIYSRLGLLVSIRQNRLRWCPRCADEDKNQFGEHYWHRLHQVPGVEVCPVHAIFLKESNVSGGDGVYELISGEQGIDVVSTQTLNLKDTCHKALLSIARNAAWLLSQHSLVHGLEFLRERYIKLLAERGLATYKGKIYSRELCEEFQTFYNPVFLKLFGCSINDKINKNWLLTLLRETSQKLKSPIKHLLLIHFLGYTAQEIFQSSSEFKPFGEAPWPCLNPVCEHFQKSNIEKCRISYNYARGRKPVGTFQCTCGFVYSRVGPDSFPNDRFRYSKVEIYGSMWEMALKNLWEDLEVSLRKIASQLGVSRTTLKHKAFQLGLLFPRLTTRPTQISAELMNRLSKSPETEQSQLESYQKKWLAIREANPNAGRKLLRTNFCSIHRWLEIHDPQWLEANMPPHKKRAQIARQPRVDWESRDAEFARAIVVSGERFRNLPGRPIQITRCLLCRDINHRGHIVKNLSKLPLTSKALNDFAETHEEAAIRRIQWAAECFHQENLYPTWYQLVKRAGMGLKIAKLPQVQQAIISALESFYYKKNE